MSFAPPRPLAPQTLLVRARLLVHASLPSIAVAAIVFGASICSSLVFAEDKPGTLDPVFVYGDRPTRGTFHVPGAGVRFILDSGGGGSGPSGSQVGKTCEQLRVELVPASARDWCRGSGNIEDLYAGAAVALLSMVAGDPNYGQQSGLGMLYQFLRMPESRARHATHGDAHSIAIRGIASFIAGRTTWEAFTVDMARACAIPQMVETGQRFGVGGFGYTNPSTRVCLTAIGVMRMEVTGAPFNADRDRTFLDGVELGFGDPVNISAELGSWLSAALEAGGFKEGLRAGNSLHAFNALIDSQVRECRKAIDELNRQGCKP